MFKNMFDSRSEFVALLVSVAVTVALIALLAVVFGESVLTVVLALGIVAVGCWVYPKVAERVR
ncbi:MAG: hypothetical protein H9W81_07585 [Enterococcus sp.]|nr:hypothetical protein [Enterococcus sp.]